MKEINFSKDLESGTWQMSVFEIGNTYQIAATNGEKSVHFMLSKRDYLQNLLKKQHGKEVEEIPGLSCTGRESLTENEFGEMKKILFTHMDNDLIEEKTLYAILPETQLE